MAGKGSLTIRILGGSKGFTDTLDSPGSKLGKFALGTGVALAAGVGAAAVAGIKAFAPFELGEQEVFTLLPGISRDRPDAGPSAGRQTDRLESPVNDAARMRGPNMDHKWPQSWPNTWTDDDEQEHDDD